MDLTKTLKKRFPEDTLLRQFVIREIKSYDLPERKGKKRGELIGLNLSTFISAVLHGITTMQLNEIADLAGASYGALRHAVRGKRFQNVADGWQGAFSVFVADYLKQRIAEIQQAVYEGGDVIEQIAATPPIFNDAHLYREETLRRICWVYFHGFTSAASLIACPRDIFTRVVRIVFNQIDFAGRIAERAYLDRVNEFLRLHSRKHTENIRLLIRIYLEGEAKYNKGRTATE